MVLLSTTYKEFKNYFEKDRALVRRFQKIDVKEPSKDETIKILEGLKTYYEEHHNIKYSPEAIISAVELSNKYIGKPLMSLTKQVHHNIYCLKRKERKLFYQKT